MFLSCDCYDADLASRLHREHHIYLHPWPHLLSTRSYVSLTTTAQSNIGQSATFDDGSSASSHTTGTLLLAYALFGAVLQGDVHSVQSLLLVAGAHVIQLTGTFRR